MINFLKQNLLHNHKKWSNLSDEIIDVEEMSNTFMNIYLVTNYVKFRSFQFRAVAQRHCIKYTLENGQTSEIVVHFFPECSHVKEIWNEIQK